MHEMTRIDDLEAARNWVTSRLGHGWTLSKALLRTWDFSAGSVWTTIHEALGPHDSLDFIQGGKSAEVRGRGLDPPKDVLGRFIARHLASQGGCLVVEDELRRTRDASARDLPGRAGYLDNEVHWFVPPQEATPQNVHEVLVRTKAPFLNVMTLTSVDFAPHVPENGDEISREVLERAAEAAITLIVGAYDEEAHVVWIKE